MTDGVYITGRWLHLLDVPGLSGLSGPGLIVADWGLVSIQGLIAHQLYKSHKAARRAALREETGEGKDSHIVGEGTRGNRREFSFDPHRIQQDPEPRRRYPGEGLLGETYSFLLNYYFNKHLRN